MYRFSRIMLLAGMALAGIGAASQVSIPHIRAAASTEYVIIAEDDTDWAHCTASLTTIDGQGHVTLLWKGLCGQGPVSAAVIRFSTVPLEVAEDMHQRYEPISAGEAGKRQLAQAILALHHVPISWQDAGLLAGAVRPDGSCLGNYYHATADVYSMNPGAPSAKMHLDQKYNLDPVCRVHAYDFTYSKDSGATVVRIRQSAFFDQGGSPLAYGGESGCSGSLGSGSGNFNGASAPLSDFSNNLLDSAANLGSTCNGTSYDWDLNW